MKLINNKKKKHFERVYLHNKHLERLYLAKNRNYFPLLKLRFFFLHQFLKPKFIKCKK